MSFGLCQVDRKKGLPTGFMIDESLEKMCSFWQKLSLRTINIKAKSGHFSRSRKLNDIQEYKSIFFYANKGHNKQKMDQKWI